MQRQLIAGEHIWVVRDFLSAEECAGWIERTEAIGYSAAPW